MIAKLAKGGLFNIAGSFIWAQFALYCFDEGWRYYGLFWTMNAVGDFLFGCIRRHKNIWRNDA